MKKLRTVIGMAICSADISAHEMALSYAQMLTSHNIDTMIFTACGSFGKEYAKGENSVFGLINCDNLDGLIICSDTEECIAEEICGDLPVVRITPGQWDTVSTAEFVKKVCGCEAGTPDALLSGDKIPGNYGLMLESLIEAESYGEYIRRLSGFTGGFGDAEGFFMCMLPDVMYKSSSGDGGDKISLPYIRIGGKDSVDFSREFDKTEILPDIASSAEEASVFVFSALHFLARTYGYIAVRLNGKGGLNFREAELWRRYAAAAMKMQRIKIKLLRSGEEEQVRDSLTGLLNMRGYINTLTERGGSFDDKNKRLRIVSIDIENLKGINDSFGYDEGDRVLNRIAFIMSGCAGENDVCVRVGGDEFFIAGIIDNTCRADSLLEELKNEIDSYNSVEGRRYGINIYSSCVTAPLVGRDVLETLPYEASYQRTLSKENHSKMLGTGRSNKDRFDPEERKNVIRLLNENSFTYNFQPIVDAKSGDIRAYEALMRSGDSCLISPISILSHAEAIGRLYDIEKYTLFNTLEYLSKNPDMFKNRDLFINCIPSCILSDKDFEELYSKYSNELKKAVIEFTEQTEADEDQLNSLLSRSSLSGYRIAIDDYGTGYSNISNLLNFMPNYVKIDRSLIMNIHKDKRKQHFTRNIIDYAHDNNFKALAEGVELYEELQTVIAMGVDLIQGYYTAKPANVPVVAIKREISDEIKAINRSIENKKTRKTYFTGNESEISLMSLDFDGYTDVVVNKSSYTFLGNTNYQSEIVIRIKDGIDCTLNLVDVSMKNEHTECCIFAGQGSRLTLNICGSVQITGSIEVPEKSSLLIEGDGMLSIQSSFDHSYAIGADMRSSFGNIEIRLKNRLFIHLDSEKSIAIGGGSNNSNSKIVIDTEELIIEQTGKFSMGIGSLRGAVNVVIRNTKLGLNMRSADCIGIGSAYESICVHVENSELDFDFSGNSTGGIVSYHTEGSSADFRSSSIKMTYKAKDIFGIGSDSGDFSVVFTYCTIDMVCEGANAAAIGSLKSDMGAIEMFRCKGEISVNSSNGKAYGVNDKNVSCVESDINIIMNQ